MENILHHKNCGIFKQVFAIIFHFHKLDLLYSLLLMHRDLRLWKMKIFPWCFNLRIVKVVCSYSQDL